MRYLWLASTPSSSSAFASDLTRAGEARPVAYLRRRRRDHHHPSTRTKIELASPVSIAIVCVTQRGRRPFRTGADAACIVAQFTRAVQSTHRRNAVRTSAGMADVCIRLIANGRRLKDGRSLPSASDTRRSAGQWISVATPPGAREGFRGAMLRPRERPPRDLVNALEADDGERR